MISDFDQANEKAFGVGVTYDVSYLGLTGVRAFAAYAYGCMTDGRWEKEINATVDYRISTGTLKNFWVRLRYAHNAAKAGVWAQDFRVILNYAFNF
jgi:hypothetical protein